MEPIHDRLPVIIPSEAVETWLSSADVDSLNSLMLPCPDGWPVNQYVNNARNEGPACIQPLTVQDDI